MNPFAVDKEPVPCPVCKHGDTHGVALQRGGDPTRLLELARWCPACGAYRGATNGEPGTEWKRPITHPSNLRVRTDCGPRLSVIRGSVDPPLPCESCQNKAVAQVFVRIADANHAHPIATWCQSCGALGNDRGKDWATPERAGLTSLFGGKPEVGRG